MANRGSFPNSGDSRDVGRDWRHFLASCLTSAPSLAAETVLPSLGMSCSAQILFKIPTRRNSGRDGKIRAPPAAGSLWPGFPLPFALCCFFSCSHRLKKSNFSFQMQGLAINLAGKSLPSKWRGKEREFCCPGGRFAACLPSVDAPSKTDLKSPRHIRTG